MIWLIIVFVLALVIGPVMYLVPNAKDKRLTALRAAARASGLTVQITSVAKLDPLDQERVTAGAKHKHPRIPCSAYQLPVTQRLVDFEPVMLVKLPPQPTVVVTKVLPGWALDSNTSSKAWTIYDGGGEGTTVISGALARLPEDCLALALDRRFVACYWLEHADPKGHAVESIAEVLADLRNDLRRRFAQAQDV